MPVTIEQAKTITQAVTIDVWNDSSRPSRIALLQEYCSPHMKTYAPDGSETTGIEECDTAYDKLHADGRAEWNFKPLGDILVNGNLILQFWFFGDGDEGWKGWDVIILDEENKVVGLYGLVQGMHNHQAGS